MLNELAKGIYENAVAHGWHDQPITFGDVIALCHSELSEALKAFREKQPMCYCETKYTSSGRYGVNNPSKWVPGDKPEGIAVELVDCIIRILEYCGSQNIDVDAILKAKHEYNKTRPYRHGGKAL